MCLPPPRPELEHGGAGGRLPGLVRQPQPFPTVANSCFLPLTKSGGLDFWSTDLAF